MMMNGRPSFVLGEQISVPPRERYLRMQKHELSLIIGQQ